MEQHWEHKIRDAYNSKDTNTTYPNKDKLWNRISGEMKNAKGGAAFWKVAAVFMALVMFGGVFAAISIVDAQNEKMTEIENQNSKLQGLVDSLMNIEPEHITEIQIVEKEKLIYRETIVQAKTVPISETENNKLKADINKLKEQLLLSQQNQKLTNDSLLLARSEKVKQKNFKQNNSKEQKSNFKLKPERIKDQMQQNISEPTPKMKIQLFKLQETNIKFDTNSTLLKK